MKWAAFALGVFAVVGASSASATQLYVKATGTVESIATVSKGVVDLNPNIAGGLIKKGDGISYSFTLDTATATVGSLFDADPVINIYSFAPHSISLVLGGYTYQPMALSGAGSSIQLWNDRKIVDSTVDLQSISAFDYPIGSNKAIYPFAIGSGSISESIGLSMYDFTGKARSNDLISEIVDPNQFSTRQFSYGLLNSSTDMFYHVMGSNMSITISAVPEPATWGMMIFGFGAVGHAMRRRTRTRIVQAI